MELEIKEVVKSKLYVAPCIKCGGNDISIWDANESSFNYGGGTCKKCKRDVTSGVGIFPGKKALAGIWNAENDPRLLIQDAEKHLIELNKAIARTKKNIAEYRKLQKKLGL